MESNETVIYQGRKMNVSDIQGQIDSLIERSTVNPKEAGKYLSEAQKLIEFKKSLNK